MKPNMTIPNFISAQQLAAAMGSGKPPLLIDVRRKPAFEASAQMLVGATWHDPERIDDWCVSIDKGTDVVVYCVHGHQVSQNCAARLCKDGFNACYLDAGFEHWLAEGYPTMNKQSA
jgi:thiosulfate sulfurtransferase